MSEYLKMLTDESMNIIKGEYHPQKLIYRGLCFILSLQEQPKKRGRWKFTIKVLPEKES